MQLEWKRNVVLFLVSQQLSLFGSSLVQYAIMWHITLTTQSGVMMMVSVICGFLPQFFMSPFAGVWADRYNRKTLIALADSGIALATLVLALAFMAGRGALWMLFAASALRALGSAVHQPAVSSFLPQLVPADQLMRVNALNQSVQSGVLLVSPMLSAAILGATGIQTVFFIDVVTAALAVSVLLLLVRTPAGETRATQSQRVNYFYDMREGIVYIWKNSYVRALGAFNAVFYFFAAPLMSLTPLQVTRSFGNEVWRLSAIEVVFSVGMMVGGLVLAAWGGFKNKVHSMMFSVITVALGTIALGVTPVFWLYIVIMGLIGCMIPMFSTPATVLLQQRVDANYLGRVFGAIGMLTSVTYPLAMLVWGPLADLVSVESLLLVSGAVILIEALVMLANKPFVEAGAPQASESAE